MKQLEKKSVLLKLQYFTQLLQLFVLSLTSILEYYGLLNGLSGIDHQNVNSNSYKNRSYSSYVMQVCNSGM